MKPEKFASVHLVRNRTHATPLTRNDADVVLSRRLELVPGDRRLVALESEPTDKVVIRFDTAIGPRWVMMSRHILTPTEAP